MSGDRFQPDNRRRRRAGALFKTVCLLSIAFSILSLALLLFDVVRDGAGWLSIDLLTHYPSRIPERAGIKSAILGTLWMMGLTAAVSFPIGVGAAVYLEEYAPENWLTKILQTNIANLAGVPSIVYGILGLAIFVRYFSLGRSVIAGALTLALLILPVIIIASQEAIKAVPVSLREASYGVGATKWQTIRHHIFPMALPGIASTVLLNIILAWNEAFWTLNLTASKAAPLTAFIASYSSPEGLFYAKLSAASTMAIAPILILGWFSQKQLVRGLTAGAVKG